LDRVTSPEEETSVLLNLVVFVLIGLFVGGTARLFYPGRQPMKIVGTLVLGMVCALLGGLLSWAFWPEIDNQYSSAALLLSLLSAVFGVVLWALVAYARSIGGHP
jgi:uncharacterized membrane protein YeaQ/YmgE (transglycosylase-associated protein family)